MLMLLFLLTTQAPIADEMAKLLPAIKEAQNMFVQEARKLSGTVTTYDVTEAKKLLRGHLVKIDAKRYLVQETDASQKPTKIEIYRQDGDIRQALHLARRGDNYRMVEESYRKKGEPAFDIESNRVFAFDAPACIPLRPVPTVQLTILDLLEYPAVEVTKIENLTMGKEKVVKITYQVNKSKNDAVVGDDKLTSVISGWVALRPDHLWTVHSAEYSLPGDRRRPGRTWKADYLYESSPGIPVIKEIQIASIDQKADKPDLKLVKHLFEFALKPANEPFTDKDFSMAQFGMKERTAADWLVEVTAKEKAEAEELAKIAALPPGATKPASSGVNVDPWVVLGGGVAAFVLLVMWVFWKTSKPARPSMTTPPV